MAKCRTACRDIAAVIAVPAYDESTRDGYIIGTSAGSEETTRQYEIIDEIPAGKPYFETLKSGTACKIMTGGCIPKGGLRVVPSEDCIEQNGAVIISERSMQRKETYIRKKGSEIAEGELLVPSGTAFAVRASCFARNMWYTFC